MGATLVFILGSLVLYNFWIRVINKITNHHSGAMIWLQVFLIGCISTTVIYFFPRFVDFFGINSRSFIDSMNAITAFSYVGYLLVIGLVLFVAYVHRIWGRDYVFKMSIFLLLFISFVLLGLYIDIPGFILYFSIVAFGEEYIKYAFGYSLFEKFKIHYTDLLLFCLISGLSFAFIENIAYAWYAIEPHPGASLIEKLTMAFQVMLTRGLVNVGIHAFFTGIIGYFTLLPPKVGTNWLKVIFGIACGSFFHLIYNSLVSKGFMIILPITVLASYIMISYILYKADTLFNQPIEQKM